MDIDRFRFDRFCLEPENRLLSRDGEPVEINARYLDALALMVRNQGRLVSKDRFLDEVWSGVPVTDEALTQCIRTLRRLLGDDAARPSFIETVPKHGYRFIAPVSAEPRGEAISGRSPAQGTWRKLLLLGAAGTTGGAVAGIIGGLCYGFAGASQAMGTGVGATSVLLVLLILTFAAAVIGAAGVSFGIAAAQVAGDGRAHWTMVGGAAGGLMVGAVTKLLGIDAFNLLVGTSPGDITGAAEGALIGGAVGLAVWHSRRSAVRSVARTMGTAALVGGVAGALIPIAGGRLMGGSLDLLARTMPGSRLQFGNVGLFGEAGFGPLSQIATGALEGALFAACIVGAMTLARRWLDKNA